MKVQILVEFDLPSGARISDAIDYVHAAVLTELGFRSLDDPMYQLDRDTLRTMSAKRLRVNKGDFNDQANPQS